MYFFLYKQHNDLIEEIGTKIVHPKSTLPTIVKDIPPLSQLLKVSHIILPFDCAI